MRNAIEQASVLAGGNEIQESDLNLEGRSVAADLPPPDLGTLPFSEAKKRTVEEFEKSFLLRALRAHDGNISRTAESIGMVRQSLQQKIRELGLRSEDWGNGDS
jgi:DNA-binding NtrC family response regulator